MTHTTATPATSTRPRRSATTRAPRAVLVAVVGLTTLLLAGPAAAGCGPLDELPTVGVPTAPDLASHVSMR